MRYLNVQALSAANTSLGVISGAAISEEGVWRASVQAVFDTTVAGKLILQGSNDAPAPGNLPTHWADLATTTITASGTTGFIAATEVCCKYLRVSFDVTTQGTSTVVARLNAWSD